MTTQNHSTTMPIEIRYVKRLLMAYDFTQDLVEDPVLPSSFFWAPWRDTLLKTHARLVHAAFSQDLDGRIFPTFKQYAACEHLIHATTTASSFAPEATWLIGHFCPSPNINSGKLLPFEYCAAIQCEKKKKDIGEIQNVSVHPNMRKRGLGRTLTLKALHSFQTMGIKRVTLEATVENAVAIRMYDSIGFRPLKYFYTETFVDR